MDTCLEWNVCAQGCFRQNLSLVTIYSNINLESTKYVFNLTKIECLMTSTSQLENILKIVDDLPNIKHLIVASIPQKIRNQLLDLEENRDKDDLLSIIAKLTDKGLVIYPYEEFLKIGDNKPSNAVEPKTTDIAAIMFTSGTTGAPKGVILTHKNIISSIAGTFELIINDADIDPDEDRYISFLPLAHVLAFVVHYCIMALGVPIGYAGIPTLTDKNLKNSDGDFVSLRPTIMVGAPAFFDTVKREILKKVREKSSFKQNMFNMGYSLSKKEIQDLECESEINYGNMPNYSTSMNKTQTFQQNSMDEKVKVSSFFKVMYKTSKKKTKKKIFNPIKELFGGRLRLAISGGSALSASTKMFIETCLNAKILEGYGLTESAGPATVQKIDDYRNHCVGIPIPSLEVKLVSTEGNIYSIYDKPYARGEIWLKGNNIASGYYKNEEETSKAFTKDGWFKTGDIGLKLSDGSLMIIDRIKNIIKPPHGSTIAVEALENIHSTIPLIKQICVYADTAHNECVALIVPDLDLISDLFPGRPAKALCNAQDKRIVGKIMEDISKNQQLRGLKEFQFIHAIYLICDEWTVENGGLTAASKKRRNFITDTYKIEITKMYMSLGYNKI